MTDASALWRSDKYEMDKNLLKPQANNTRELVNLDGLYRLKVDTERTGKISWKAFKAWWTSR